jgi:hypothetical protein
MQQKVQVATVAKGWMIRDWSASEVLLLLFLLFHGCIFLEAGSGNARDFHETVFRVNIIGLLVNSVNFISPRPLK